MLTKTASDRLHSYIVVSLLTGGRTEELRALRWEHVHLEADGAVPSHVEVWRSARVGGDTKTRKSRRTLALPERCIQVLRRQRAQQAADRLSAGERWQETGLVFSTSVGTKMLAGNVRRDFRRALALVCGAAAAGGVVGVAWVCEPLMSSHGVSAAAAATTVSAAVAAFSLPLEPEPDAADDTGGE